MHRARERATEGPDRWQVRFALGKDPETGQCRVLQRECKGGTRDAQRLAAKLVTEVERGEHRQRGFSTVEELLARWITTSPRNAT